MKAEITPLPWTPTIGTTLIANVGGVRRAIANFDTGEVHPTNSIANAEYAVRACNAHPELVKALEAALADIQDDSFALRKSRESLERQIESALALAGRAAQSDGKEKE